MSEDHSSSPITAIVKPITDIVASVAAVVAYLQAIFQLVDVPFAKTISLLTILGTSILVVNWRWTELNRKKKNATGRRQQNGAGQKTAHKSPLIERILDPIKQSSRENYILSLVRRRFEAGLLLSITVFTIGWVGFNVSGAITELKKDPLLSCNDPARNKKLLVLVADLLETTSPPKLLISDKIYDSLVPDQSVNFYKICRLFQTIKLSTNALETAKTRHADILIWGRSDVIYEIHLEAPALANPNRKLSELASDEAASVQFQFKEPKHIAYVTQFALSELLLLNGQLAKAQTNLSDALASAKLDGIDATNPKEIADGYFLLGLLYDPGYSPYPNFSPHPDQQQALDAYNAAVDLNPALLEARLNRGLILKDMGKGDEAMADFTFLIENKTSLQGSAYINRADLQSDSKAKLSDLTAAIEFDPAEGYFFRGLELKDQGDYLGAIQDFEKAVQFDPQSYYNYHLMGESQLYAGQFDAAKQTYVRIIPTLHEEDRQQVISELQADAQAVPEIKSTVDEIIRALRAAKLP